MTNCQIKVKYQNHTQDTIEIKSKVKIKISFTTKIKIQTPSNPNLNPNQNPIPNQNQNNACQGDQGLGWPARFCSTAAKVSASTARWQCWLCSTIPREHYPRYAPSGHNHQPRSYILAHTYVYINIYSSIHIYIYGPSLNMHALHINIYFF